MECAPASIHFRKRSVARSKQQKKKDREKRVAKKKLADAARLKQVRKTAAEKSAAARSSSNVMTDGVREQTSDLAPPKIEPQLGG